MRVNLEQRDFRVTIVDRRFAARAVDEFPELLIIDSEDLDASVRNQIHRLRRAAHNEALPLVLLTSRAPPAGELEGVQPVVWLEKPFSIQRLIALIQSE
jgi:DNA-binding response OmpR family regulator